MKILIVRHAPAKDSQKWLAVGGLEEERPLTQKGQKKMERAARGLRTMVDHVDRILSSPWLRALQTAHILQQTYDLSTVQKMSALLPSYHPDALVEQLLVYEEHELVVLVGHETHLSVLLTYLTSGKSPVYASFQKGGAALVECEGAPRAGCCKLKWLLTRDILELL